jgi:hypothetical protein
MRILTNGLELGARGGVTGNESNLLFWDADETVRTQGTMKMDSSIVRVSGRSLQISPGSAFSSNAYLRHVFGGAASEAWLRLAYRQAISTAQPYRNPLAVLEVAGGDVAVKIDGSTNLLSIWRGGSMLAEESVQSVLMAQWFLLELHFKAHATAGRVELRVDGNTVLEFDGNTGTAAPTGLKFGQILDNAVRALGLVWFDDVALNDSSGSVSNSWVGDGHTVCLRPTGNGAHSELTGSDGNQADNWALVDENPASTADYVEGLLSGLRDSYSLQSTASLGVPSGATIKHCEAALVGTTVNVGADAVEGGVRAAAADNWGAKQNLHAEWSRHVFPFPLNPGTGLPWETSELDDAECGIRTQSA